MTALLKEVVRAWSPPLIIGPLNFYLDTCTYFKGR